MNLPAFCIRKPAFTIVISLVMIIIGLISFMNLPVRWIPNVNPPEVSINTTYPGASAQLVERDITKVIESTLSGIDGIEEIDSFSDQGSSNINITFKLERDMNVAVEDVRRSLEIIRDSLPKDALSPIILKADPNNDAIMYVSFSDAQRNERELSDYVHQYITPSFETIDGVGAVWEYGRRVSAMRISLDPARMAAANVTADEITQILHDQNASIPSGQIRGKDRDYEVIANTSLKSAEQFNDLIIRDNQNQVVRLRDIAHAQLEAEDTDSAFRVNGKPGIALAIVPQSTANPLEIEKGVQKVFAEIKRTLPAGMQAKIMYNQADYIRASMHSVYESFIEAVIFVWLVILLFLGNFRATIVPIITIPVCLISAFALLAFFKFSINTITLMAFVLAIGLVVDDAIVMLENISRYIEEGMSPFNAALKGSKEIIFPIIVMTLTLVAVYVPIAFTPGLLGTLFREFTFTLAGAVVISGIIALTLSPMMCARLLGKVKQDNHYIRWQTQKLLALKNTYQQILGFLLNNRKWVLISLLGVIIIGGIVYAYLPSELAPTEDMNTIYVSVAAPRSSSFNYTDTYIKQLEAIFQHNPDIDSYLSIGGRSSAAHGFQILMLKPAKQRTHSTDEIIADLTAQVDSISGVRVNIFAPPPPLIRFASGGAGDRLGLVVMTNKDYQQLQKVTQSMVDQLKENSGFVHVDHSLKWDGEQFELNINRDRAADLKVSIPTITNTISTLLAGRTIGKMDEANIMVQLNQPALANPNVFDKLYVRNNDGLMVPMSSMVNVSVGSTPEVFRHYARLRSDTIYMTLAPNYKLSKAIKALKKVVNAQLSSDMKFTFTGEAKSFLDSNGKTAFTFLLALVFIYLVLVAQFESFIDPLIILFTVPFAMVGALISLKLFGGSLNIYSNIGLISLVGLIAKHGILITDFANRLRLTGKTITEAIIEAASLRLRPILMTTAAMVLGALPLAYASGPGAESRQQIGLVIAGGMLFGTLFSLIIVPIAYTYLAPFRKLTSDVEQQELNHATVL